MLYLSALKCRGAEACKATEVARLVSTWRAAIQLLSSLRRWAPLCACLCVCGEALCLVQLQKLFTTDYREKDVIMIITLVINGLIMFIYCNPCPDGMVYRKLLQHLDSSSHYSDCFYWYRMSKCQMQNISLSRINSFWVPFYCFGF